MLCGRLADSGTLKSHQMQVSQHRIHRIIAGGRFTGSLSSRLLHRRIISGDLAMKASMQGGLTQRAAEFVFEMRRHAIEARVVGRGIVCDCRIQRVRGAAAIVHNLEALE